MLRLFTSTVILLSLCFTGICQSKNHVAKSPKEIEFDSFVNKYAFDLKKIFTGSFNNVAFFLDTTDFEYISYPSIFHEQLHSYNLSPSYSSQSNTSRTNLYFFDTLYALNELPFFNSMLIEKIIPTNIKNFCYSYNCYILGFNGLAKGKKPTSQTSGLNGLLEEAVAFSYNCKVFERMYDFLKIGHPFTEGENWVKYIGNYGDCLNSCYELKIFIAYYLLYAKEYQPELYVMIQKDSSLRTVINRFDQTLRDLTSKYYQLRNNLFVESRGNILTRNNMVLSRTSDLRKEIPDQRLLGFKDALTPKLLQVFSLN